MNVREIYQPLEMYTLNYGIRRIPAFLESFQVDMDPDYQRDHVWTLEQRQHYIGFLLQGGKGLPIVVNSPSEDKQGNKYPAGEIIDGKQRITSILRWLEGDYAAILNDGRTVHVDDYKTDGIAWRQLGTTGVDLVIGITNLSRTEVLDYYLRLNSDGTHHTQEEIERVRNLLKAEREAS